jgi:hypothetical protein
MSFLVALMKLLLICGFVVELTFGAGSFLVSGVLGTCVGVTPEAKEKG